MGMRERPQESEVADAVIRAKNWYAEEIYRILNSKEFQELAPEYSVEQIRQM
jgi:hypothetical protein